MSSEEYALVGPISGKLIPISKADAERIAAKGDEAVVRRQVSAWEDFEATA